MTAREMMVLFRPPRHELDPLDLEILERAFDATWAAVEVDDALAIAEQVDV